MQKMKILILVVIGFFILFCLSRFVVDMPVTSSTDCYVAILDKDVYALRIGSEKDGNFSGKLAFNNFEKDSSSGSVVGTYQNGILLGTYSFQSEGMDSKREVIFKKTGDDFIEGFGPVTVVGDTEKFKDIANITYDSKSRFVAVKDCARTFIDINNTFGFDYNAFFVAREGNSNPTTDWRVNSKQKGTLLATVFVPRGYLPQTNFSGVTFTVGRSADAQAIKSCTAITSNANETKGSDVAVAGYPFATFRSSDAGAGNFYDTVSYRGIFDGDCYVIEYTIHSANIGNYSPDQGVTQFDSVPVENEMEKIINSFKFLIRSN